MADQAELQQAHRNGYTSGLELAIFAVAQQLYQKYGATAVVSALAAVALDLGLLPTLRTAIAKLTPSHPSSK